jgi:ribosomal protein S18 acetylase RimI-like enzyme
LAPNTKPPTLGYFVDLITDFLFPPSMKENYATEYSTAGILGAVVVDTLLEHIPPKRSNIKGGYIRELPRKKMAYLSNLAVAPTAQRRGLGLQLLRKAEDMASIEWGCRTMTLHVDPSNTPAVELYKNSGYRFVAKQPEWQRMLEGRQTALALMLKVLPRRRHRDSAVDVVEDAE